MIKIKLTENGGYVVGDGPCPFDPDEFIKYFGAKMICAKAQGLTELGLSQEEIEAVALKVSHEFDDEIDAAPVIEMPNWKGKKAAKAIMDVLDSPAMPRPRIVAPQNNILAAPVVGDNV